MSAQNTYLQSLENWANIYLSRSLAEYFDYLKSTDVTMQQAYVLTFIHYNGPSKISDICENMMVSAAAASQMVDRLEKQSLVKRIAEPADRRVRKAVLTEEGRSFVEQSIAARQSWMNQVPADLSEQQMEQISDSLEMLISLYQE